jgi:hypothetical protein
MESNESLPRQHVTIEQYQEEKDQAVIPTVEDGSGFAYILRLKIESPDNTTPIIIDCLAEPVEITQYDGGFYEVVAWAERRGERMVEIFLNNKGIAFSQDYPPTNPDELELREEKGYFMKISDSLDKELAIIQETTGLPPKLAAHVMRQMTSRTDFTPGPPP